MSTIEKRTPMHLWRSWDKDWQLAGQWDKQPSMSELVDAAALTVDYPNGRRDSWRVADGQLVPEPEFLKVMVWSNPLADRLIDDGKLSEAGWLVAYGGKTRIS
jgi:hypothetical protein